MEESNLHRPPAIGLGTAAPSGTRNKVQCAACCVLTRAIHGYGHRGQRKAVDARDAEAVWTAAMEAAVKKAAVKEAMKETAAEEAAVKEAAEKAVKEAAKEAAVDEEAVRMKRRRKR